jgi:hypothetical protein
MALNPATRNVRVRSIVGAVLLLAWSAATAIAAPAGTVVGVSGTCVVESAGNSTALALGAAVQVGDTVDVGADGRLKLRMADGSIVAVGSGTRMTVTAYAVTASGQRQAAQLALAHGLLHTVVSPSQPAAKFEVDTAVGTAAVRSTDWLVEATATDQEVSVLSGSVVVTSAATRRSVIVPERQTTRLERGHDPQPPRRFSQFAFSRLLGRTELRPTARHAEARSGGSRGDRHGIRTAPRTHRALRDRAAANMKQRGAAPARRRAEPGPDRDRTR